MSAIYLDNSLVHYEVFGRGQPIIFLHSWVGSWRYWVSTMEHVSERYRAYALDFWGFGESDRKHPSPTISMYVKMLHGFLDDMGINKVNLVGHGLGGMVAIRAAKDFPERLARLVLVSTPLQGSVVSSATKPGAFARILGTSSTMNNWSKLVRQIPIDDPEIQQELYDDTDSLSEQVVKSVQRSIVDTDLRSTLQEINNGIPLLAVYGEKDSIVPPDHAQIINDNQELPHQYLVFPGASHFPFLENTTTFSRLIMDFMLSKGTPIEIKEQWRRRVSQRDYL